MAFGVEVIVAGIADRVAQDAAETGGEPGVHFPGSTAPLLVDSTTSHEPNTASAAHVISRLGIWAQYLADGLETGAVSSSESVPMLRHLARAGGAATREA